MYKNQSIRNHIWAFLCLSGLFAMPYANATVVEKVLQDRVSSDNRYWFVNSAARGKIIVNPSGDKGFSLVLEGITPYISYFTDRPQRQSGTMRIQQLLKLWEEREQGNFRRDPPNAALSGILLNGETGAPAEGPPFTVALELLSAHYDPVAKTLSYNIKPLKSSEATVLKTMTLQHVTLFIDDVC